MSRDIASMDFQGGEVLLFDKPYGWTSFDVVRKIRYAIKKKLKVKKIKVGHAGTLDPLATGLLQQDLPMIWRQKLMKNFQ